MRDPKADPNAEDPPPKYPNYTLKIPLPGDILSPSPNCNLIVVKKHCDKRGRTKTR